MRKIDGWQTLATKPIDQPTGGVAFIDYLNKQIAW
jgi:hypothetical protein